MHQCQGFVWCCERCHCHFGAHSMVPHLHTSPSSNFTLLSIRFIRLFRSFVRSFVLACLRIRYASFPFVLIFSAWIWIHSFLLRVLCMSALTACTDYIFASTTNTVSSFIACVDGSVFPGFLPPPNPLPPPSSPLLRRSANHRGRSLLLRLNEAGALIVKTSCSFLSLTLCLLLFSASVSLFLSAHLLSHSLFFSLSKVSFIACFFLCVFLSLATNVCRVLPHFLAFCMCPASALLSVRLISLFTSFLGWILLCLHRFCVQGWH